MTTVRVACCRVTRCPFTIVIVPLTESCFRSSEQLPFGTHKSFTQVPQAVSTYGACANAGANPNATAIRTAQTSFMRALLSIVRVYPHLGVTNRNFAARPVLALASQWRE